MTEPLARASDLRVMLRLLIEQAELRGRADERRIMTEERLHYAEERVRSLELEAAARALGGTRPSMRPEDARREGAEVMRERAAAHLEAEADRIVQGGGVGASARARRTRACAESVRALPLDPEDDP